MPQSSLPIQIQADDGNVYNYDYKMREIVIAKVIRELNKNE